MAKIINNAGDPKDRVAVLPAGTYLIGDPCYFVPDELWMEYLRANRGDIAIEGLTVQLSDGRHVAAQRTAYGDGEYRGSDGFLYGVDAGLIGAVEALEGEEAKPAGYREALGTKVTFNDPFQVSYEDGKITIGHIIIDTDPSWEEDEGDWDDEE